MQFQREEDQSQNLYAKTQKDERESAFLCAFVVIGFRMSRKRQYITLSHCYRMGE